MLRRHGFLTAGALALVLLFGSPLAADPGSRRAAGEGLWASFWSWVAVWAEEGLSIDPNCQPRTDEGPMIDPDGLRLDSTDKPTVDAGASIDPNG